MNNQVSMNDLINSVAHLSAGEFEEFFSRIQSLKAQKMADDTHNVVNKLLKQLKTNLLSTKQVRFEFLIALRESYNITPNELEELLKLTDEIEKNDVVRLKKIAKLADLMRMSLPDVMRHYDIKPVQYG